MGRPKQSLISRRKTLEVALRIIDEEGLDALSIRRLGAELNVRGISLYHHFESKEQILVGACELALSNVRTPKTTTVDWREWLVGNCVEYYTALRRHPNLVTLLMLRHPLRIGLAEHNATAGLLAVQGVPPAVIMPILDATESFALGCAAYELAIDNDNEKGEWATSCPALYHASKVRGISHEAAFGVCARAIVDAILAAFDAEHGRE